MKKLPTLVGILSIASAAVCAPTANEDFVVAEDARTFTNAVAAANAETAAATNALAASLSSQVSRASRDATNYTDAAIAALPEPVAPDYSPSNTQLVATIEAVAPAPGNYATVSNRAMSALQSYTETDPSFAEWATNNVNNLGEVRWANNADVALKLENPAGDNVTYNEILEAAGLESRLWAIDVITQATNAVVEAAEDYTDAATNVLLSSACSYTDAAIAAATNGLAPATPSEPCRVAARSWNRPSAFALAYDPILAENSTTFFDISTNAFGMVWSNVTATTAKGLAAKFFFDSLDPLSAEVAPLIQSLQVTGGGVAVDNVVTVPTAGVYRVTALTPGGEARTTRAAFSALRSKTTHGSYYVADTNANRQAVNDYAATALAGMEPVRTGSDPAGNSYTIYSTCLPGFAAREGTGQFTPFAVAPRFAATAAHYPWVDAQNVTYTVNGQTFTIKRGAPCFTLYSWAVTNGFDEAELRAAAADDIEIVPLADYAQFPADACPHFATPEWIARNYGSLDNLVAWTVTQRSEYGIPAVVTGGGNELAYYWLSAGGLTPQVRPRTDLVSPIGEYNERGWWRVQVGDSGKPVWFVDQSSGTPRPILISHFKYVSGGPNYCAAARVLAALCQQYNTTFKLLQ